MRYYDLAIIGSGPGGYVSAIYASRHNLKCCVIERDLIGGTCLNRGCIPTKSLLNSVSIISGLKNAAVHGVKISGYAVDFESMMSRKDSVVRHLRAGIETLLRANNVDAIAGPARLKTADTIAIHGEEEIKARNIIVAVGSHAAALADIKVDNKIVFSSDSVSDIKGVPANLAVIGGGAVGCEFAGLFSKLGSKVTIIELSDRLVSGQSREVSKRLESIFKRNGIDVRTSAAIRGVEISGSAAIKISDGSVIKSERVLVSVGRVPNIEGIGLEEAGIKVSDGRIEVDEHLMTDLPNVYAVGDCVPGPQSAHKASYDGILACDNILGTSRTVDYSNIPNCIWTEPEIASVGLCEEAAKADHQDVRMAKFPYLASGKAFVEAEIEGFVKIAGTAGGEIVGVEIFGKDACNLIGEAVFAKTFGVNIKDWGCVVHGHPTLSEVLQEACRVFCGTPIHSI